MYCSSRVSSRSYFMMRRGGRHHDRTLSSVHPYAIAAYPPCSDYRKGNKEKDENAKKRGVRKMGFFAV
jgi:hypothetical protein